MSAALGHGLVIAESVNRQQRYLHKGPLEIKQQCWDTAAALMYASHAGPSKGRSGHK